MITWVAIGKGDPMTWKGKAESGREYTIAPHAIPGRWVACRNGHEFNKMLPNRLTAMAWCEGVESVLHYSSPPAQPEPKIPESFGGVEDLLKSNGYNVADSMTYLDALRSKAEPVAYAIECEPGDPKLHSLSFWKQHLEQIVTAHSGKVIPLYRRP